MELSANSEHIVDLERQLGVAGNGDYCPKCLSGCLELVDTKHGLGHFGVEDWTYRCGSAECGFEQKRLHDPHGAVAIQAKKR